MTTPNEYGNETNDPDLNDETPAVETAADYGPADPPTDVPAPPDDADQNPGHTTWSS